MAFFGSLDMSQNQIENHLRAIESQPWIGIVSWPIFPSIAWKSMKGLFLHLTRDVDPIEFWDGDMDSYLPNLIAFTICTPKLHYTADLEEVSAYLKPEVKLPMHLQEIVQFKGIEMSTQSFRHGIRRSHQCKHRFEMLKEGRILESASRSDSLRKLAKIVYEVSVCRSKKFGNRARI